MIDNKNYTKNPLATCSHSPPIRHQILNKQFIKRFKEVVVIGDVHGCYDELIQLLDQIHNKNNSAVNNKRTICNRKNADNNRVLKLFVGDLVNKGPKNIQVLDYLIQNNDTCRSVRGNHDEIVIAAYLKYKNSGKIKQKNLWMQELSQNHVQYLIGMPYTISIPTLNALVVHAGVVPNQKLANQSVNDMVRMRNVYTDDHNILRATVRDTMGEEWVNRWSGPQHIYFGHDSKRNLQLTQFATGLDTGCVYGRALTAVFICGERTGSRVSVDGIAVHCPPKIKATLELKIEKLKLD